MASGGEQYEGRVPTTPCFTKPVEYVNGQGDLGGRPLVTSLCRQGFGVQGICTDIPTEAPVAQIRTGALE